jgi:hypothetical protein
MKFGVRASEGSVGLEESLRQVKAARCSRLLHRFRRASLRLCGLLVIADDRVGGRRHGYRTRTARHRDPHTASAPAGRK